MTVKLFSVAALALVAAVATVPANASTRQQTIDANQAVEAKRIADARLKGDLTRSEYRALQAEQARIAEMERKVHADGHVSKREYNKIHDAQIGAYRHIKSESNDGQVSWFRRWLYRHPG
jgi:uncharacterized membrane protein